MAGKNLDQSPSNRKTSSERANSIISLVSFAFRVRGFSQTVGLPALRHIFVIFECWSAMLHQDLEKVVTMLSRVYEIPILPGLDAREKSLRPEGSCDKSILQKFHECFSSQLMELD